MKPIHYILICCLLGLSLGGYSQEAIIKDSCEIYVPNVITMDCSEGKDYQFRAKISCQMDNFSLKVYNRWGEAIFDSKDASKYWDAKDVAIGTYVWILETDCPSHGEKKLTGHVSVIR